MIFVHFLFAALRQMGRTCADGESMLLFRFLSKEGWILRKIKCLTAYNKPQWWLLSSYYCSSMWHSVSCPLVCSSKSLLWGPFFIFSVVSMLEQQQHRLMHLNIFRLSIKTPNVYVNPKREQYIRNPVQQKIQRFKRFIENYRRHIVCVIIVYGITAGVTLERCYCEQKILLLILFAHCVIKSWLELIRNTVFRLWFAGWFFRCPRDFSCGHHRVPWFGGRRLLSVSLHAPHCLSQPYHIVPRNLPQPIHPLRCSYRLSSLHGHDCHHPSRLVWRENITEVTVWGNDWISPAYILCLWAHCRVCSYCSCS